MGMLKRFVCIGYHHSPEGDICCVSIHQSRARESIPDADAQGPVSTEADFNKLFDEAVVNLGTRAAIDLVPMTIGGRIIGRLNGGLCRQVLYADFLHSRARLAETDFRAYVTEKKLC